MDDETRAELTQICCKTHSTSYAKYRIRSTQAILKQSRRQQQHRRWPTSEQRSRIASRVSRFMRDPRSHMRCTIGSGRDNDVLSVSVRGLQHRKRSSSQRQCKPHQCVCVLRQRYGLLFKRFFFCSQRSSSVYKLISNARFHSVASNTFIGCRRVSISSDPTLFDCRRHAIKKIKVEAKQKEKTKSSNSGD